ncbi:glutathione S-transferase family protein [Undibacterium sp.]|jgi:glutathione S-transferase|uniref:glutathione S-transferase family protein n=1 Tax=Undibacterium sp. TaxID=1914977 RepID=UPI002C7DB6E8|nr:glutathione S-transferase family protein [Undibacterium sp.]HTD05941.1 glutathione S-transferase family protein [Undibacterium sp.]
MIQLYYYPGNANLAPHMLLEELGIPYELVLVDTEKGAQHDPQYMKLNPCGRIPVLVDGDLVLFESAAICLYLADAYPDAGLAPSLGTVQRAHMYKWLMYLTNTLQTELISYFYSDRLANDAAAAAQVKERAEQRVSGMLDMLEAELKENAEQLRGVYLLGPQYSVVDPYLLMLCRWTRAMRKPAKARPYLATYLAQVFSRPAVSRAFEMEGLQAPFY